MTSDRLDAVSVSYITFTLVYWSLCSSPIIQLILAEESNYRVLADVAVLYNASQSHDDAGDRIRRSWWAPETHLCLASIKPWRSSLQ